MWVLSAKAYFIFPKYNEQDGKFLKSSYLLIFEKGSQRFSTSSFLLQYCSLLGLCPWYMINESIETNFKDIMKWEIIRVSSRIWEFETISASSIVSGKCQGHKRCRYCRKSQNCHKFRRYQRCWNCFNFQDPALSVVWRWMASGNRSWISFLTFIWLDTWDLPGQVRATFVTKGFWQGS